MAKRSNGADDAERDLITLLGALPSRDDQPGADPAFVQELEARLIREHPAGGAGLRTGAAERQSQVAPRFVHATTRPVHVLTATCRAVIVAAALLALVVAADVPATLRLLVRDATVATIPAVVVPAALGRATPEAGNIDAVMERGNAGQTGEVPGSGPEAGPALLWRNNLQTDGSVLGGGSYASGATVANATLYLSSTHFGDPLDTARLTAIDTATGETRWEVEFSGPNDGTDLTAVAVTRAAVYVGVSNYRNYVYADCDLDDPGCLATPRSSIDAPETAALVALAAHDGTELWRRQLGEAPAAAPVVADGVVYAATPTAGALVAVDAATGRDVWTWNAPRENGSNSFGIGSPAVAGGLVYVDAGEWSGERVLYALDAETGRERWRFASAGRTLSWPMVADDLVVVSSFESDKEEVVDPSVVALDAATGRERWSSPGMTPDAMADGVVFGETLVEDRSILVAVDARSGAELWRTPALDGYVSSWLTLANGTLFFSTVDRVVTKRGSSGQPEEWTIVENSSVMYAYDADDGSERWTLPLDGEWPSFVAVGDGSIFIYSDSDPSGVAAYAEPR